MWGLEKRDLMILAAVAGATFLTIFLVILCLVRTVRRRKRNKMQHLNR